jgi:hypothetical protein
MHDQSPSDLPINNQPPSNLEEVPPLSFKYSPFSSPCLIFYQIQHIPQITQSHGIAINTRLRRFVCLDHQCLTSISEVRNHLLANHVNIAKLPKSDFFTDLARHHHLLPNYPSLPTHIPHAYHALQSINGYSCSICRHGFKDLHSIKAHHRKNHPSHPLHYDDRDLCTLQRFTNQGQILGVWFQVCKLPLPSLNSDLDRLLDNSFKLLSLVAQPAPSLSNPDPRDVEPWLQFTSWNLRMNNYDPTLIRELVRLPTAGQPFHRLYAITIELFEHADSLLSSTHESLLCRLNQPEDTPFVFFLHSSSQSSLIGLLPANHLIILFTLFKLKTPSSAT